MASYDKSNPFHATLKSRELLTDPSSEKKTHHLELDISGSGLKYDVGDCAVIFPGENERPRFYSIASSMRAVGDEIHLTVKRLQDGVCSDFLCEDLTVGDTVPLYIHPARTFKLPEDDNAPIIMIGPGTGVAPYRGFMQERIARGAQGPNWLFFGEWSQSGHFFYEELWTELNQNDQLHLDLAFSREGPEKVYVQHRLLEQAPKIWQWLQEGAYLYVCGDAKRMAKDVDATLQKIIATHGDQDGKAYLKLLRRNGRYLRDIY